MSIVTGLALCMATFLASFFATRAMINIAPKVGLVCESNHRSSHGGLMPSGGGVGFVVLFFVASSVLLYLGDLQKNQWMAMVGCGSFIAAIGLWDDVIDTSVLGRLVVQFVCVSIGTWLVSDMFAGQSVALSFEIWLIVFGLTVFILMWWLNLFNFMDGIDGLAGSEALFMALGAAFVLWLRDMVHPIEMLQEVESIKLLLVVLSASVLGFIVYNWAPAKIFMGDVGSTFLGFILGMIALSSIMLGVLSISVWLILGAVFWVDATITLMRRIVSGERWYMAHRSHAYQHAVDLVNDIDRKYGSKFVNRVLKERVDYTHGRICSLILFINIFWMLPLACLAVILPELEVLMLLFAWAPLIWVAFRLGAGKEKAVLQSGLSPWPYYSADEINAVSEVLRSGNVNYWTGGIGRSFESGFAAYCGASYGIALANGSVALELALKALEIGSGDEVIVPPRTFIATVSSVVLSGAVPVFADVDADSQNISVESIRSRITPRTKAIIVVHLAGWPCDMGPIMDLADERGLKVIEDCAQAHGARYKGRVVGGIGDVAAFSFCQDKIMTTGGEGGMLVTNDEHLWRRAWAYKDHGKDYDAMYRNEHDAEEVFRWVHESFGTNWRMTEMQSSIGLIQTGKLDMWVNRRRENAMVLAERLKANKALRIPIPGEGFDHAYYKFYVFVRPEYLKKGWSRDLIIRAINAEGMPCFNGSCSEVYREKAFVDSGLSPPDRLPVARELGETSLMFPVHPTLCARDMQRIADAVDKVMAEATN